MGDALVAGEEAVLTKELLCACCVCVETCGEGLCKVRCADAVCVFCSGRCVGLKVVFEDVHPLVAFERRSARIGGAGDTVVGDAVVDHVRRRGLVCGSAGGWRYTQTGDIYVE